MHRRRKQSRESHCSIRHDHALVGADSRLPVTNAEGILHGMLSLNDIVLRTEEEKGRHHPELNYEDAMSTIKAICEHRPDQYAAA